MKMWIALGAIIIILVGCGVLALGSSEVVVGGDYKKSAEQNIASGQDDYNLLNISNDRIQGGYNEIIVGVVFLCIGGGVILAAVTRKK